MNIRKNTRLSRSIAYIGTALVGALYAADFAGLIPELPEPPILQAMHAPAPARKDTLQKSADSLSIINPALPSARYITIGESPDGDKFIQMPVELRRGFVGPHTYRMGDTTVGGYIIGNITYNRKLALQKTGYEIAFERFVVGVDGFKHLLDLTSRDRPPKEVRDSLIVSAFPSIQAAARKSGLEDELFYAAVVYHESGAWNWSISSTGAIGEAMLTSQNYAKGKFDRKAMRYTPARDPPLTAVNPLRPEAHESGAEILATNLERYQNPRLALLGYNQGAGMVDSAMDVAKATKLIKNYFGADSLKAYYPRGSHKAEQVRERIASEDGRKPQDIGVNAEEVINAKDPLTGEFIISDEGRAFPDKVESERATVYMLLSKFYNSLSAKR